MSHCIGPSWATGQIPPGLLNGPGAPEIWFSLSIQGSTVLRSSKAQMMTCLTGDSTVLGKN